MTTLHNQSELRWLALGGYQTAGELSRQPAMWRRLGDQLQQLSPDLRSRIRSCADDPYGEILLVGADSAGAGAHLAAQVLGAVCNAKVRAVPAASLCSHPVQHLGSGRTRLAIVCESDSAGEIAGLLQAWGPGALIIDLVGMPQKSGGRVLTLKLPCAAASFSIMLLAALGLLDRDAETDMLGRIEALAALGAHWMARCAAEWHTMGQRDINRVVFAASGDLQILANESARRMMEMSEGQIAGLGVSPSGLRCGLKHLLKGTTQLVLFRGQDAEPRRVEDDLIAELKEEDGFAERVLVLDSRELGAPSSLPDAWLAVVYALPAQVLALHHSVRLGVEPDRLTRRQERRVIGVPAFAGRKTKPQYDGHSANSARFRAAIEFYGLDRGRLNAHTAA